MWILIEENVREKPIWKEDKGKDEMEIVGVSVAYKADTLFVGNCTGFNILIFIANEYHKSDLWNLSSSGA